MIVHAVVDEVILMIYNFRILRENYENKISFKRIMKTYKDYIKERIRHYRIGAPIYLADLATELGTDYNISIEKSHAATSVALKRLMDNCEIPNLRLFQKGIYFLTQKTVFGEVTIDKEAVIRAKYMEEGNGYEYGAYALYKLGLTTQLPNQREIVSNKAYDCRRKDQRLDVWIKPTKTEINQSNIEYLMILDVIDILDKYPVDVEKSYRCIAEYIDKKSLKYEVLLVIADKYYNIGTIKKLARIAGESVVNDEAA